jgi:hypothetical protein
MRREQNPLPEWTDIGVMFVTGFKFCMVHLIYSLPIILLYIPFLVITIIAAVTHHGEIPDALAGLSFLLMMLVLAVGIPYGLLLTAFSPIIMGRFARNESIGDALDVRELVLAFKKNWQNTLIVALIGVGIRSFSAIGIIVFVIGIFFTIFYSYLVTAYMAGTLALDQPQEGVGA